MTRTESNRLAAVQTPVIPVVAELIQANPGTISLGQGVVNYPPPPESFEQIEAFKNSPVAHKYQAVDGIPQLKRLVEAKLLEENGIDLSRGEALLITAGGNQAFMNAVLAVTDPGDEVILQTPYYFNHEMAITMAGAVPVLVQTDQKHQLQIDAIAAAITAKTRAIVTVSPNNPTGAVYPESDLRAVNELCAAHGVYHIHDEAYEYFTYDGARHFSPASLSGSAEHTISLFSLSKAYGFASWRIGYMTAPNSLTVALKKIQDTILICPPVISQYAAIGALRAGRSYCDSRRQAIISSRQQVRSHLDELQDLLEVPPANGAFYFLLRLRSELDPMEIVRQLIEQHGVAVIPGSAFGLAHGCHLRVAYGSLDPSTAGEAVTRLANGLRAILKTS